MVLSVVAPIVPVLLPPVRVKTTVRPPLVRLFPTASRAWSVRVSALPDANVALVRVTSEVTGDATPAVTVIVGNVELIAAPPIVALMARAVPANTPVKVAEYVPLPLSVVTPIVPVLVPAPVVEKTTVKPPLVRLFPAASFAWSVSVALVPDAMAPLDVVTVEFAVETAVPCVTVIDVVEVIGAPPNVALMVIADPAEIAVNVAV